MENTKTNLVEDASVGQTNVATTSTQEKDGFFGLHQRGTSIKTEIMAGTIIFMSMFYIVGVQMSMLGGPMTGINAGSIGIVTALAAGLTSILMGLYAKHPGALAPGMGVNAFVAYTLVAGGMDYQAALSAVLISGLIFIVISVTPVRGRIMNAIPDDLKKSISIGVGLFLLFVALANGGVIGWDDDLGGTPTFLGNLTDPFVLLSLFGITLTIILWVLEVPAGILIGMFVTIVIGVLLSFTNWNPIAGELPSLTFNASDYGDAFIGVGDLVGGAFIGLGNVAHTWANPTWYMAIFTLFLMDFFDTTGTLFGLNSQMGDFEVDEETNKRVLIVDAIGTAGGAIMGSTNITIFAESATGIQAGGRTGLTSITVGILFLLSIPLIPLLQPLMTYSVTAGPVFLIGIAMASNFKNFNTEDKVILSSSVTIIMFMILGYSIGLGIVIGLLLYIILMVVAGRWSELDIALIATSPLFVAFLVLPIFV